MPETLSWIVPYATFGGSAGAGFVLIRWMLDWASGRIDKNRASLDAGTEKHIDRLEKLIERQDEKIRLLEERQEECERERAEMRGELAQMRAMLAARGEIRQRAQQIVAADKLEEKLAGKIGKATAK